MSKKQPGIYMAAKYVTMAYEDRIKHWRVKKDTGELTAEAAQKEIDRLQFGLSHELQLLALRVEEGEFDTEVK